MLNQDIHKNLRRNKGGICLEQIEPLPGNYRRPPGFSLVPTLLSSTSSNDSGHASNRNKYSYFDNVQDEMSRYDKYFFFNFIS